MELLLDVSEGKLRCSRYVPQFSELLPRFPAQGSWKTMPGTTIDLAEVVKKGRFKETLEYFGQAASVVARENVRFHLIQEKQAKKLLPQLTALQNSHFSADEWQAHLSAPNAMLITAFNAKGPIGFILGHQEASLGDVYVIDDVALDPEYQNRGIGSWLLKSAGWMGFEMNLCQLIGFVDGKEALSPNVQEFLRGVGAEEISSGIDGGHYLRLDLTASCLVPQHMSGNFLLGCTTGWVGAWVEEAQDPSWHRRVKTSKVPADIKEEKGGLGEDVVVQSGRAKSSKTLVELLKGINWKDVPPILPDKEMPAPATMRKHPDTAATFDQPFCARPEIIPFVRETYLFRYILENFGEAQVEAIEDKFVLSSGGETIGRIKAEPKNGIFTLSYHGKTHPEGRKERMVAIGKRRIDQSLIDLGDLYYLMNICFHYQHLESRFEKQVPELTQVFYVSLRGSHTARALLTMLFALNHMQEAAHINNLVNALLRAGESGWPFLAFWVLVEQMISKGAGWDRIDLACGYILKVSAHDDPLHQQVSAWSRAEGVFKLQDEIYGKAFGPINIAIIQMVEAGASAQDLDQLFAAAMTSTRVTPAFNLFFVAATLFKKSGSELFQKLIDCLKQSTVFEKYSNDTGLHEFRHLLADAAVNLLIEKEKETIQAMFEASEIDQGFGTLLAQTAVLSPVAAKFIAGLLSEIKLSKDRRIREKLSQVIWVAQPLLKNGQSARLIEAISDQDSGDAYKKLDRLFNLLQFSSDEEGARLFASEGIGALQEHLFGRLSQRFGFEAEFASWPTYTPEGFVRSVNQLLRDRWTPDPNVGFLLGQVAEHGGVHQFYRSDPRVQQTVALLSQEGYNVEQLVYGSGQLMQAQGKKGSVEDFYSAWVEIGRVAGLLFEEKLPPAFMARVEEMRDPEVARGASPELIRLLREELEKETGTSRKKMRRREELIDLLNGIEWQAQHGVYIEGGRIESRKSIKAVPEMLFDNRRLACCIFFPNGELRDEIPLVAMDPQTPVVEFWVSELDESAGMAIEYAGKNRDLFLDTFEFSQSLTAVLGGDPTFRFVTDSLVLDAHLSKVRNLLIFKANYGHPMRYLRYVERVSKQRAYQGIIEFDPRYSFELADPDNHALRNSKNGIHTHYTDAFRSRGYRRRPLKGRVPVFVIDVEAYYEKFRRRIKAGITT